VHAAAIAKARRKGAARLADLVYSGVPASMFGSEQKIEIGFMSGKSNVVYCLESRGIEPDEALVTRILDEAKRASTVLSEDRIDEIVAAYRRGGSQ
jgi:2-isopropylmalate synthase